MNTDEFLELVDSSGLSKVDLAVALNMSRTSVYNWLRGGNIPKKNWKRIREILSLTQSELKELVAENLKSEDQQTSGDGKVITLNESLFENTKEVGELVLFLNKDVERIKNHPLLGMFTSKIAREAVNKYKDALISALDQETFTKEEVIKKVLSKTAEPTDG